MAEHRILAEDHATQWMGIEVVRADPGHCILRMTVKREMLNGFAITHGGMVFAMADTCFALTCNHPTEDDGTMTVATGVDINFLAQSREGEVLEAEGRLISQAGRSGLCDITVRSGERTIAEFRGRCRRIDRR
ncbi:hotdog fold thioesterase [Kocuria palustris]|uniref:hotdog fold thioesterase n=1 Tax=Kocuria palustris TaxID=71999 RepID=UPI0011A9C8F6|nr:hotdog fold thioesterase [Kocuria palustris]